MFNISFAEFIVIMLLAFLILGPNEMVKVARFLGHSVRKCRTLLWKIKEYVNEEAAETGLEDVKHTISEVKQTAQDADLRHEFRKNIADKTSEKKEADH